MYSLYKVTEISVINFEKLKMNNCVHTENLFYKSVKYSLNVLLFRTILPTRPMHVKCLVIITYYFAICNITFF